jgi:ERCC4-type nuclease
MQNKNIQFFSFKDCCMSNEMAVIVADARERHGAIPHLDSCIAENNKFYEKLALSQGGGEIRFLEDTVHIGDYSILLEIVGKHHTAMVFERKTWKDLASSIKDGRAKSQHRALEGLRQEKGCLVCYLIEGNFGYNDKTQVQHIAFKNLYAKLRHNFLRGIPFIQTRDEKHTAKVIVDFARDILRLYRTGQISFPLRDAAATKETRTFAVPPAEKRELHNEYINELRTLNAKYASLGLDTELWQEVSKMIAPHQEIILPSSNVEEAIASAEAVAEDGEVDVEKLVNIKLARGEGEGIIVPEELKTKKVMPDCDILERMWMALPTVSDKSAPVLMQKYRLSDIICANPTQYTFMQEAIAELKFSSGMKLGDSRAKKIMAIAYLGDDPLKKEQVKNLSVKVLAQIPQVTEATARVILEQFSLRDICSGKVNPDDIASLKKGKNRGIGAKLAERICSLLTATSVLT